MNRQLRLHGMYPAFSPQIVNFIYVRVFPFTIAIGRKKNLTGTLVVCLDIVERIKTKLQLHYTLNCNWFYKLSGEWRGTPPPAPPHTQGG